MEQIRAAGVPLVMVDSSALPDQPGVEIDDEGGARAAAEHLLAPRPPRHPDRRRRAARRPAPSSSRTASWAAACRGYQAGARGAGACELDPQAVVVAPASIEGGIAALRRAWEDGLRPTGVLAMSDAMAIGVLRAARELGLRVPEDLSVVGFDDIDISQHTNPPLDHGAPADPPKGESAVRLLLSVVERRDLTPEQLRLETRLIVRGSTGPAPRRRQEVDRARS